MRNAVFAPTVRLRLVITGADSLNFMIMKPRDVFGLIIRIFGLATLILAFFYFYSSVEAGLRQDSQLASAAVYGRYGVIFMFLSVYLLRGAPHVMRFAYPEKESAFVVIQPEAKKC